MKALCKKKAPHQGTPRGIPLASPERSNLVTDPADPQFSSIPQSGPGASPAAASSRRYRLDPILVGLALLVGLAACVGAIRTISVVGAQPRPIASVVGAIIALVGGPFLVSWVAFRIASRSHRVANIAFTVVLVLGLVAYATRSRGPVGPSAPVAPNSPSIAEIRAISEEARKASLEGDEQRALKLTAESAAKLDEVASTAKGSEKVVMEYAANLARAQNDVLKQYIDAAGLYSEAGGANLSGLADPESLDRRLALLGTAISTHDAVIAYFRTISDRIPRDLSSKGVAKKESDEFLSGFVANAKIENLLAIHAAEHGMLLAARKRFDLLKSRPGAWSVGPQGQLIAGEGFPESDLAEFHRLQSEIDSLAEKQGVLILQRKSGG